MVGLFMVLPLAWSLYYREPDAVPFGISIGITVGSGLLLWFSTRAAGARPNLREALVLVSAGWVLAAAYSALPYLFAGTFESYLDAYFEAMSGYTTTGASVLNSIESQPHGILLWRSLTQWLGGMGIVMLFVAIFPLWGVGAAYLVEAEAGPGPEARRLTERIGRSVRALWWLYLGMSTLEVVLLLVAGLPFYDALTVTFSTMPTGGFCPNPESIGGYNIAAQGIVTFFMAAAGINFGLYYILLWKRSLRDFFGNRELRLYVAILAAAILFVALDLIMNGGYSIGVAFRYSTFQTVSIQTTTGFVTTDYNLWPTFSRMALLALMMIGACAGSTGGAIKVVRVLIVEKYIYRRTILTHSPRAVLPLKLGERALSERLVGRILAFVAIYMGALILFSLVMSATGLDFTTALSSVAANLGNVGPGLGSVGPAANYAHVHPLGKIVLTLCMLLGRLEFWPVLALATPAFWRWR